MQVSHSRIESFGVCPKKYEYRYLDKLQVLPRWDDPSNALTIGVALHTGIEKGVKEGLRSYFESFPVLDDLQINEAMKLERLIPKVEVPEGAIFEEKINDPDFIGFIDMLVPVSEDGMFKVFDLYDFKYSNHIDRYLESPQLHLYKYFYERTHPYHTIRNLSFIFVPKTQIRQKKTEELAQFRKRLLDTLDTMEVKTVSVKYDPNKVIKFLLETKSVLEATEFPKNECKLCDFCDYKEFCKNGVDYMLLPSTARRSINAASRKKIWLYGAPFSGKTTLADHFPTPIMLNTDGNVNSFTAPMIEIRETYEGRQKISAWEVFKNAIDELQKGSDFKTIVVDLTEDTYEHCRQYCYAKFGFEHESDAGYGKGYDLIRTEFLSTMKKLLTLDYNVVLISHEDMTKDITRKSGDKITAIKPNIQEKTALKLAGMVDIVARVVADGDDRQLQFKSDDVVFGGGRLQLHGVTHIPLTYEALEKLYESQGLKGVEQKPEASGKSQVEQRPVEVPQGTESEGETAQKDNKMDNSSEKVEQQPVRRRRSRKTTETTEAEQPKEGAAKEQPEGFDEVEKVVREACDKYSQKEIFALVRDRFGIRKFSELDPKQYPDVIEVVKSYGQAEVTDTEESLF